MVQSLTITPAAATPISTKCQKPVRYPPPVKFQRVSACNGDSKPVSVNKLVHRRTFNLIFSPFHIAARNLGSWVVKLWQFLKDKSNYQAKCFAYYLGLSGMASMKSSEASSSMSQSYEVFLSFRGPDTRYSFTDHLYKRLEKGGYQVFRDKEGIADGWHIGSKLQVAIQKSKISIVVLSKDYSSSKWCLDEFVTIMNSHQPGKHDVLPVFYHVDPSDVRNQSGSFAKAFVGYETLLTEDMDRVEGWRAALRKVGELKGEHVKEERYETEVIQRIVEEVGRIMKNGKV